MMMIITLKIRTQLHELSGRSSLAFSLCVLCRLKDKIRSCILIKRSNAKWEIYYVYCSYFDISHCVKANFVAPQVGHL